MSTSAVSFCIEGYMLTIWPECYLVEVRPCPDNQDDWNAVSDLPPWVFDSRLAIWLTEGREEIRERALLGERVKRQLAERTGRRGESLLKTGTEC